ncbi:MAG TPA: response regulator transcription factor [Chitinophagaceae bacterium]|nr:response regulator transcription factor [Chitinophagaceae bacterium]HPH31041.1 response regulator transcription factor [Chitinophagaceae bacterium]HPN57890.1 response regulator transcription factor [Chitinophagaceae bacterium]
MRQITVFIVDDNKELRNALEEIVSMSEGYHCIGTASSAEEAVDRIPIIRPDVVLMDINLGTEESGIDVVRTLKPRIPDTNFMICTVYEEDEKIFEALSAGASGYILKKTPPGRMLEAIRELYEGGAPMSSQIARKVVAAFQHQQSQHSFTDPEKLNVLTPREMEILELLSKGLMYKEIATQTFLSPETVRKHVYHIYEKLHVTNRVAAVNKYYGR